MTRQSMITRRLGIAVLLATAAVVAGVALRKPSASGGVQSGAIKIGEINSYKAQPAFLEPYKRGWELAVEQINASGGIAGRKLEVLSRDDNGVPGDAVRVAEELLTREGVVMLTGSFLSHVGLAISDFAKQRKVLFLAAEPLSDKITWDAGHKYTYRLRSSTYMQTSMLIPGAVALKKKRWALVYPNYEYGQSAVASFKALMTAAQPGVEFVTEQATPLGKIEAGAVTQALADAKPDAIFNVTFGADLAKFVREGTTRGLFKDMPVFSLLGGEPEYLDPLKDETPVGWYVTGYPSADIATPEHKAFADAYNAKYNEQPKLGSVVGYAAIQSIAAALKKAGSTDTEKLVAAMASLEVGTPFGRVMYRTQDNQSTMGAYVGRLGLKDGKGVMTDWRYEPGDKHLPSDAVVKARRPAG
jgi:branched-chain amino acid transport system substrate-binding protein